MRVESIGTIAHGSNGLTHRLWVEAAPGEANRVLVRFNTDGRGWTVTDEGVPLTAGEGCSAEGDTATCSPNPPPGFERFTPTFAARISLGDGDDRAAWTPAHGDVAIAGGDGADELVVAASSGPVTLSGGSGPDTFRSESVGASLDYTQHPDGVNVTPDGVADDGALAEGDNVIGRYSALRGSRFADRLVAGTDSVEITGGDGDDTLIGSPGKDWLRPGLGDNDVYAGGGDDELTFSSYSTGGELSGGPGTDRLYIEDEARPNLPPALYITLDGSPDDGAAGARMNVRPDIEEIGINSGRIVGSDADERLGARDGVDGGGGDDWISGMGTLKGGPGRDVIAFGGHDLTRVRVRARDGEPDVLECRGGLLPADVVVDRRDTAPRCAPAVTWGKRSRTLRMDRRGYVTVSLRCATPADIPCRGTALVRSGPVYARGAVRMPEGRSARVRLKVAARWRQRVRAGRRLRADLDVVTLRARPRARLRTRLGAVALRR